MMRIFVFLAFMGMFSLAYQLGSMSAVDEDEAQKFLDEFKDLVEDIDAIGIFSHNMTIALPMFIPGFGIVWGMFAAWSTGYAFASIAALTPQLADVPALAILYLSPFGLMELAAYSLGTSRSYLLARLIFQKKPVRPHLRATAIEIGIMAGLLLAGGFVEFHMIEGIERGDMGIFEPS